MEQKTFNIYKQNELTKVQIGTDIFALDLMEARRVAKTFTKALESKELFPACLTGSCIMFPNGLIAANISIAKADIAGTTYLLFVYSLTPNSDKYDVNTFMLNTETLRRYIDILNK